MQPWRTKGANCLFCSLQPLIRPTERTFTTTPILQRSGSQNKKRKGSYERAPPGSGLRPVFRNFRETKAAQDFPSVVESALHALKQTLSPNDPLTKEWRRFERYILSASNVRERPSAKWGSLQQVKSALQKAYLESGVVGLRQELEDLLHAETITAKYSTPNLEQQKKITDLRYPAEWYPQARSIQRTIHLHVGPTNSGKTYHALKRLEASKNGFYAGPLRLLAQEVYNRFTEQGISCSLVTGDEVKVPEDKPPTIVSNTVEMVSLGEQFEVGVIDEIQMIADPNRGWAWTRAVLGARATELHLCGETRAVPLIRQIAALTGDNLEIHRYERLNPLEVMDKSLKGNLKNLQKGDCLVSFSRFQIHALKKAIEKATGRRAAIVYGSLPAEIRSQQASLFNDPDNDYDFLVASDAIGMGLNLSVKRIIFETLVKRLPGGFVRLSVPEIKQIAGRAGRYRSATQAKEGGNSSQNNERNVGLVTSLEEVDLPYIHHAMGVEPSPLTAAGLIPPDPVIQKISAYFPRGVSFRYIIKRVMDLSQVNPPFFLCDPRNQLQNSEIIDSVPGLRIEDQLALMAAPMYTRDWESREAARAFARCIAEHSGGGLLDIPEFKLEVLEQPVSGNKDYLRDLENLHKAVILYAWLSYRLGGIFTDRTLASHVKELVEERMMRALTEFSSNKLLRKNASLRRQIALQKQTEEQKRLLADWNQSNTSSPDEEAGPVDLSANETPTEDTASEPRSI